MLDRDYQLEVIGESLAENGFFPEEPLAAIPDKDKFIVVEGNRRLAALKLLLRPELRHLSKRKEFWDGLSKKMKYDLSKVWVTVHPNREELTTLLGYRHIASTIPWEPLPKARFIAELVERRGSFEEARSEIGEKKPTVRSNYIAYRALQQASRSHIDVSNVEEDFSVFYRVLGNASLAKYIGLKKKDWSIRKFRNPIPNNKISKLAEIIGYVHGIPSEDLRPALPESRHLTKFLETTRDFWRAYEMIGGEKDRLINNLEKADICLDEAVRTARRHKQDTQVIELVTRIVETVGEILRHFPSAKVGLSQ